MSTPQNPTPSSNPATATGSPAPVKDPSPFRRLLSDPWITILFSALTGIFVWVLSLQSERAALQERVKHLEEESQKKADSMVVENALNALHVRVDGKGDALVLQNSLNGINAEVANLRNQVNPLLASAGKSEAESSHNKEDIKALRNEVNQLNKAVAKLEALAEKK
jgi:hypothetical protein